MQFTNQPTALEPANHLIETDRQHVWHPYSAIGAEQPIYPVASAQGTKLHLTDGRQLIDGMSSWWCAIHGYNVPELNDAVKHQLDTMAHVMFGGLTHEPAVALAEQLVAITPEPLQAVFFADSGSVSVEVAMKMAIQYWHCKGQTDKTAFATIKNGYHGDTFGAMSVCDPITGMHSLFTKNITQQHFAEQPRSRFGECCNDADINSLKHILEQHHAHIAAIILEPIVQAAGAMWFYSAEYLQRVSALCKQYDVLLIADEIATNFGRTGKLFACEHANVTPDIMCVGKSLTGGYMTLAATLATNAIANTISQGHPGVFMHGPTFMANPLACSVALANIKLLLASPWQQRIQDIHNWLEAGLAPCKTCSNVKEVRVLGAIGVVEMKQPVDMRVIQQQFVEAGVWVRPFGKLIYLMPAYIIEQQEIATLTHAVCTIVAKASAD